MPDDPLIPVSWLALAQVESGVGEFQAGEGTNDGGPTPGTDTARSQGSNWIPPLIAAFGMVVLMHTLMRSIKRNAARKADLSKPPRERLTEIRAEADTRRDPVERLMAEATELCQRLATQMDAKAAVLEALIDRADEAATRLERARSAGSPPRTPGAVPNPEEPMQRRVFELADQGLSSRDIAAKVGQPQGHVELMLNLRRA